jgi:hypothetical protein
LEERQKIANEKAFNKASADALKTKERLAAATKVAKEAKTAYDLAAAQ